LKYPYKLKESSNFIEKIQLGNLEDIIPMKIMSLSQRGLKKDFSDVFEILNRFQLVEVKSMIQSHYGDRNIDFYHLANAFTYFDDAENGPDIESINNSKWSEIKAYFVNNRKRIIDSFLQE
jgi:predicted nucleotidyltransferase component of viral defense system